MQQQQQQHQQSCQAALGPELGPAALAAAAAAAALAAELAAEPAAKPAMEPATTARRQPVASPYSLGDPPAEGVLRLHLNEFRHGHPTGVLFAASAAAAAIASNLTDYPSGPDPMRR